MGEFRTGGGRAAFAQGDVMVVMYPTIALSLCALSMAGAAGFWLVHHGAIDFPIAVDHHLFIEAAGRPLSRRLPHGAPSSRVFGQSAYLGNKGYYIVSWAQKTRYLIFYYFRE